jgi:hypothetical protein
MMGPEGENQFPYTGQEAQEITGAEGQQNIVEKPEIPSRDELKMTLRQMLGETTEPVTDDDLLRRVCQLPADAEVPGELKDACLNDIMNIKAELQGER